MLQQCRSLNRLLQDCGCLWHDRCQPGPARQLLSTATWTLQTRLDIRSFSCLTIRARDGPPLFRVGEIFRCHSGGRSQSLIRDTIKTPKEVCGSLYSNRFNHLREEPQKSKCCFTRYFYRQNPRVVENSLENETDFDVSRATRWLIASTVVVVVCGIVACAHWSPASLDLVQYLVGISFISSGISRLILGLAIRVMERTETPAP